MELALTLALTLHRWTMMTMWQPKPLHQRKTPSHWQMHRNHLWYRTVPTTRRLRPQWNRTWTRIQSQSHTQSHSLSLSRSLRLNLCWSLNLSRHPQQSKHHWMASKMSTVNRLQSHHNRLLQLRRHQHQHKRQRRVLGRLPIPWGAHLCAHRAAPRANTTPACRHPRPRRQAHRHEHCLQHARHALAAGSLPASMAVVTVPPSRSSPHPAVTPTLTPRRRWAKPRQATLTTTVVLGGLRPEAAMAPTLLAWLGHSMRTACHPHQRQLRSQRRHGEAFHTPQLVHRIG